MAVTAIPLAGAVEIPEGAAGGSGTGSGPTLIPAGETRRGGIEAQAQPASAKGGVPAENGPQLRWDSLWAQLLGGASGGPPATGGKRDTVDIATAALPGKSSTDALQSGRGVLGQKQGAEAAAAAAENSSRGSRTRARMTDPARFAPEQIANRTGQPPASGDSSRKPLDAGIVSRSLRTGDRDRPPSTKRHPEGRTLTAGAQAAIASQLSVAPQPLAERSAPKSETASTPMVAGEPALRQSVLEGQASSVVSAGHADAGAPHAGGNSSMVQQRRSAQQEQAPLAAPANAAEPVEAARKLLEQKAAKDNAGAQDSAQPDSILSAPSHPQDKFARAISSAAPVMHPGVQSDVATPTHLAGLAAPATTSSPPVPASIHGSAPHGGNAQPAPAETFAALDTPARATAPVWMHAGPQRAEAGFQDPSLGWVGVRADISGGGIHAVIVPDSAQAAQVLSTHMQGLNLHLADQHLPVETLSLQAGASGQGGTNQGGGQQNHPQPNPGQSGFGAEGESGARITSTRLPEPVSFVSPASRGATISVIA